MAVTLAREGIMTSDQVNQEAARLREAVISSAQDELEQLHEAVRKNQGKARYAVGYDRGLVEGLAAGREEGRKLAYLEYARSLGLLSPRPLSEVTPPGDEIFDWGPHANIYEGKGVYILRMILGGERVVRKFSYALSPQGERDEDYWDFDIKTKQHALLLALRERTRMLPSTLTGSEELVFELDMSLRGARAGGIYATRAELIALCEAYHQRMQQQEIASNTACFLGDVPETRFNLSDDSLLREPWPVLFTGHVRHSLSHAFYLLGLGCAHSGSSAPLRTIRDLLLLTRVEVQCFPGIGSAIMARLCAILAKNGLALWDDPWPPLAQPFVSRPFRSISLK